MEPITFTKEKIAANAKVTELMLEEAILSIGRTDNGFCMDILTAQIETFVLSRLNETQTITVYRDRPKFLDWLLRKPQSFTFEFSAKEVLKNPPSLAKGRSVLMYAVSEVEK